jgi:Xaa-Pro aminopeptidase
MIGHIYTMNTTLVRGRTIVDETEMPSSTYEQRVEKAKEHMKKSKLDLLLLTGVGSDKGNYTYFSKVLPNIAAVPNSYMLLPLRREPIIFSVGGGREFPFFKRTTWIRDARSATGGVKDVINGIKSLKPKPKKIGTVGIGPAKFPTVFKLFESELGAIFVPQEAFVEKMRRTKDEREISLLRKASRSMDVEYETLSSVISKGAKEYQADAKADKMARLEGARDARILWATGPEGSDALNAASERAFADGDQITVHLANEFGGYWAEMGRVFSLGDPSDKFVKMYKVALDAFNNGVSALKPKNKVSSVYKETYKVLKAGGFEGNIQEDYGLGHGIGLDNPEPPAIEASSKDTIEEGMVFSVRVPLYRKGTGSLLIEDMIAVDKDGPAFLTESQHELNILNQ